MGKEDLKQIRNYIRKLKYQCRRKRRAVPDVRVVRWKNNVIEVKFDNDKIPYDTDTGMRLILDDISFRFSICMLNAMRRKIGAIGK